MTQLMPEERSRDKYGKKTSTIADVQGRGKNENVGIFEKLIFMSSFRP